MPAFTFTADAAADIITIPNHGLLTGDGPVTPRNVGGALPTASPPLTAQTDYWVIRLDANTLRLATSSGNAMAGSYINITANGSGTNILEVGVPYRRPRTYIPGVSQIDAGDLNANFDAWKAMHALLTGQPQSVWAPVPLPHSNDELPLAAAAFRDASSGGAVLGDGQITFTSLTQIAASVPIGAPRKIVNVTLEYNRGGAGNVTLALKKRSGGALTTIATQTFSSSTGWTTGSFSSDVNYQIAPGEKLYIMVQCDSASHVVGGAVVTYSRPNP